MSQDLDPLSIPLPPTVEDIPIPISIEDIPVPISVEDIPAPGLKRKQPDDRRSSHSKRKRNKRKNDDSEDGLIYIVPKEEQELMKRTMGFTNFDTTKGKMVPGNHVGSVHVVKKRRYRQYMNRKGGFNRPLDKVA